MLTIPPIHFAFLETLHWGLVDTGALAVIALIGYLFGHRTRATAEQPVDNQLQFELSRASQIARELQQIANRILDDVASHQTNIAQFKSRLGDVRHETKNSGWQILSQEAETLLTPTMKLATNLSLAYDDLRKQTSQLTVFAGSRTDQETGLRNRRAMEEQLSVLLSNHSVDSNRFALALFCVGNAAHEVTKAQIGAIAGLLEDTARDSDVVARYSPDEFVVVMPQTSLTGASIFARRLLDVANQELGLVVFGGIVEGQGEDTPDKLLSRADSALYSARSEGESCLYQHTGKSIRPYDTKAAIDTADLSHGATAQSPEPLEVTH